jgi:hypothetical protein
VIELSVEGHEPGDVITLPTGGGRLAVRARARSAQPVISDLELVVNGRVVAATACADGATGLSLEDAVEVTSGSWIAARSRSSRQIESAFASSMASHTSPVYVEVPDRPVRPSAEDAAVIGAIIDGARTWVAELATVPDPAERSRMTAFFDHSLRLLEERLA